MIKLAIAWLILGQWFFGVPTGGGGGGGFCGGTPLHCEDFELDSDPNTCSAEGADVESGNNRSCDCSTSGDCATTPNPGSVPQGSHLLDYFNAVFDPEDNIFRHQNKIDDADSGDSQYGRMCFRPVAPGAASFPFVVLGLRSNAAAWTGTALGGGLVLDYFDSTPDIKVRCPDDAGTAESTTIALTQGTWYEFTIKATESTSAMEFCINAALGSSACGSIPCCLTCDGNAANTVMDGYQIVQRGGTTEWDGMRTQWDAIEWTSSDPGATRGCSGL